MSRTVQDVRRPPLWRELALGLVVFFVVTRLSRWVPGDKAALAHEHARGLLALETRLGLAVEPAANRWLATHAWLATVANYTYAGGYVVTSIALLVYLYRRHPPLYRWARRSCVVLNLAAALIFALYPTAPPRLTPGMSIVDTVAGQHIWGTWGSPVGDAVNQYAALPSLHFALVLWVAFMLWQASTSVVLRGLGLLNVTVTAIDVITTGNHWVLDLVAATLLTAAAIAVTHPAPRRLLPAGRGRPADDQ